VIGKRTYTSKKSTNDLPIVISQDLFAVADLRSQGELFPNNSLDGGRSGGNEVSELVGCSHHEGSE
jgi:hypothetical protein